MIAMLSGRQSLVRSRERAINELENNFFNEVKARRLSDAEIKANYKKQDFSDGWEIFYNSVQGKTKINLLIPSDFPFAQPSIALSPAPAPLTYPHVENNGILCLLSGSAALSSEDPLGVTRTLIKDGIELLDDCFTGRNTDDFRLEFLSYWSRAETREDFKFLSTLNPHPPSRIIKVWRGNNKDIFAENEALLQSWLENKLNKRNHTFESAALLWLPEPLIPSEYPKTSKDLWKIVKNRIEGGIAILEKIASKSPNHLSILLGSQSELGPCFAGITIRKPKSRNSEYFPEKSLIDKGFKPGQAPTSVVSMRYLQSTNPVGRYAVERADAAWIHGRGEDARQSDLSLKKVILLGCGSVGSFVAKLLATSGIGQLTFIDPEILTWANIGRHFLGAKHVGFSKAQQLAEELRDNYPHLSFDFRKDYWSNVDRKEPELFSSADLTISTIGDWSAEGMLNQRQQNSPDAAPIIYGWTEPFALGGHAVAIVPGRGCLRCHLNEFGKPDLSVTMWTGTETLKQEPACGVMFQPYGPIELNNTVNIITESVLDVLLGRIENSTERLWACRETLLKLSGGRWTDEWLMLTNNNTRGGFSADRKWERSSSCPVCHKEST